jgi:transmembrane 9 superfamily member 2/4
MTFFFMIFAVLGVISPQYRGTIISTLYFFFIGLSNVSGFYSARFYKMFQGTDWLVCSMLTSIAYPSLIFIILLIINFANWFEQSSAAVPIPTILIFLFIYCMLSIPNVWFGSFIGFKKTAIKNPGKVNKLSRDIPKQPWYLRMKLLVPLGGILPFL